MRVQVEAAALQNDLRLLTSRKPSPMSAGTNAAGCSYKASRGSRFIPGDWASWQGLKSSGLSGSDDLLDDVVDIQENLNRAMLELSPR